MFPTIKKIDAWLPMVLSVAMLMFILTTMAIHGISAPDPNADEGLGAHLFQFWLALEIFMIPFFTFKFLPQEPKQSLKIIAIQVALVFITCFPVFYFHL